MPLVMISAVGRQLICGCGRRLGVCFVPSMRNVAEAYERDALNSMPRLVGMEWQKDNYRSASHLVAAMNRFTALPMSPPAAQLFDGGGEVTAVAPSRRAAIGPSKSKIFKSDNPAGKVTSGQQSQASCQIV